MRKKKAVRLKFPAIINPKWLDRKARFIRQYILPAVRAASLTLRDRAVATLILIREFFSRRLTPEAIRSWKKRFLDWLKTMKFTSLDRYMLTRFIAAFAGSLFLFLFMFQLTQIFQDLRWLPPGTPFLLLFSYYFYSSLHWIIIFQPFGFLFATVYILSRMAHHRELVAVISTGTSIYRATAYLLVFTIAYYFFNVAFFMNAVIFPASQKKQMLWKVIFDKMDPKTLDRLKDNRNFSIFGANNLIYVASYYNAVDQTLDNVTIVQLKHRTNRTAELLPEIGPMEWIQTNVEEIVRERNLIYPEAVNIEMRIDAERMAWDPTNRGWRFYNGTIRKVLGSGTSFNVERFKIADFPVVADPPYYFEKQWYNMDNMTFQEGRRYIAKLRAAHEDYKEALARYHSKISYPIGMIFVVLAGIGIVDLSRRKISFVFNMILSVALFAVYYVFFAMGIAFSGKGSVPPLAGAYTGTVFFGIVSLYLYRKVKT